MHQVLLVSEDLGTEENITSPDDSQCYTGGTKNDEDLPCQTILSGLMSV
jgi:hypothetical protein